MTLDELYELAQQIQQQEHANAEKLWTRIDELANEVRVLKAARPSTEEALQERDLARAEVAFLGGVIKAMEERLNDHAAVIKDLEAELADSKQTVTRQADELADAVDAAVGDEAAITRLKDKLLRLGLPVDEEADARWAENSHEVFRSVPRQVLEAQRTTLIAAKERDKSRAEAKVQAEECLRQMEYGIKQHEFAQDSLREAKRARDMLAEVLEHVLEGLWDPQDMLGSLKVEVPRDGYPSQWLIDYVKDDLIPRVRAELGRPPQENQHET